MDNSERIVSLTVACLMTDWRHSNQSGLCFSSCSVASMVEPAATEVDNLARPAELGRLADPLETHAVLIARYSAGGDSDTSEIPEHT